MKKNLIVIFSSFFICLNAFAEKPLNIFKNEILKDVEGGFTKYFPNNKAKPKRILIIVGFT